MAARRPFDACLTPKDAAAALEFEANEPGKGAGDSLSRADTLKFSPKCSHMHIFYICIYNHEELDICI